MPNRIYEGGCFDCIPIYRESTQISQYYRNLDCGLEIGKDIVSDLVGFFLSLNRAKYLNMLAIVQKIPKGKFIFSHADCLALKELTTCSVKFVNQKDKVYSLENGDF